LKNIKEEEEKSNKKNKQNKLAINTFYKNGKKLPLYDLPWATIELIFNNRNIWLNL